LLKEYPRALDAQDVRLQILRLSALELLQPDGIAGLDAFIRENPSSPRLKDACWWRAGIVYKQRDWESAKKQFTAFLAAYPTASERDRAQQYHKECESKVIEEKEQSERRAEAIAAAAKQKAEPLRPTVVKLREGRAAMDKGQYGEAISSFENVRQTESSPEYEAASYFLGLCHVQRDKPDLALAVWNEALRKGTNALWLDDCLLAKGMALVEEKGEDKTAESLFREVIVKYPESPRRGEAFVWLGITLMLQSRQAEAEAAIREARKCRTSSPDDPWDPLNRLLKVCAGDASLWPDRSRLREDAAARRETALADLLFASCDYRKAQRIYSRVANSSKDTETSARAMLQAGRCWNQIRQYAKALDCYERFMKSPYDKSSFADAALLRAGVICVGHLNQSRKGKEYYQRILERYPGGEYAEMAELYLCTLAFWEKDWKKALDMHEVFVKRHPNSPNTLFVNMQRLPTIRKALTEKGKG
jgi:TolA-binding protein